MKPPDYAILGKRGVILLPPRKKKHIKQEEKKTSQKSLHYPKRSEKKNQIIQLRTTPIPPPPSSQWTSRPHPPRHPLLMPLIPPPNPAKPIIKSHILPLNPNPPRITNPPLILYNLMSAQSQIQRKTTLHNPPQNTTFAQNFPINQSLLIPREIFFHHCQFGCGEEVRFGNDDQRRAVRGGFVFEL